MQKGYTIFFVQLTEEEVKNMAANIFVCGLCIVIRPKKKIVMLPSPDQNLKIGSVGLDFFFFFFFYVPWESWVFQYFF